PPWPGDGTSAAGSVSAATAAAGAADGAYAAPGRVLPRAGNAAAPSGPATCPVPPACGAGTDPSGATASHVADGNASPPGGKALPSGRGAAAAASSAGSGAGTSCGTAAASSASKPVTAASPASPGGRCPSATGESRRENGSGGSMEEVLFSGGHHDFVCIQQEPCHAPEAGGRPQPEDGSAKGGGAGGRSSAACCAALSRSRLSASA